MKNGRIVIAALIGAGAFVTAVPAALAENRPQRRHAPMPTTW
jgi:hypothetical protein